MLATAILATALAFSVQVWAQQHTSSSHTAILFSLEPVFAALTSFLFFHERMGGRALAGAALILAGILLVELRGTARSAGIARRPGKANALSDAFLNATAVQHERWRAKPSSCPLVDTWWHWDGGFCS